MFHKHNFQPLQKNENRLYCYCGEKRCIHEWEVESKTRAYLVYLTGEVTLYVLKCKHCGALSNHRTDE